MLAMLGLFSNSLKGCIKDSVMLRGLCLISFCFGYSDIIKKHNIAHSIAAIEYVVLQLRNEVSDNAPADVISIPIR